MSNQNHTCPNCTYIEPHKLSKRETETINNLLLGIPRKRLQDIQFVTIKTLNTYVSRAQKKIGVHDLVGVYRKLLTTLSIKAPDLKKSADYRDGYQQALSDALNPDAEIFNQ